MTALRASALVTGASGFIGRRLVRRLVEHGGIVSCLVRATSSTEALMEAGANLCIGDVTDLMAVEESLSATQPDVVFHLAGLVRLGGVRGAVRGAVRDDFMVVNAGGVEAVATSCAACATKPTLVVVSSLAAAGPCEAVGGASRTEGDVPAPVSAYGRSKLAGERAAAKFAGRLPITIVRPPIVIGPGDRGVLEMMRPIARWGVHPVPGRGDFRLSLVHVDDLVDALLLAAERGERVCDDAPGSGVYFTSCDESPTYAELGGLMAHALGRNGVRRLHVPPLMLRAAGRVGDMVARFRRRKGWINSDKVTEALAGSWACSSQKANEDLGWRPAASLSDRLKETAQWYRGVGWL